MEKLSQFLRLNLKFMVVNLYLYVEVETQCFKLCFLEAGGEEEGFKSAEMLL